MCVHVPVWSTPGLATRFTFSMTSSESRAETETFSMIERTRLEVSRGVT